MPESYGLTLLVQGLRPLIHPAHVPNPVPQPHLPAVRPLALDLVPDVQGGHYDQLVVGHGEYEGLLEHGVLAPVRDLRLLLRRPLARLGFGQDHVAVCCDLLGCFFILMIQKVDCRFRNSSFSCDSKKCANVSIQYLQLVQCFKRV